MKLIKDIIVAIWVAFIAVIYFMFLFLFGLGILIYTSIEDFIKKRLA